jgi:response regulator RpfG family c-di-GMP phosphodiesterase
MIATIIPMDYPPDCLPLVTSVQMSNTNDRAFNAQKLNSKKILLIDPEDDLREVIQTGLELTTSWEILTAHSHAIGANLAEVEQPHAILLNVERVDCDRAALLIQLKTNPTTQGIPVILMTDRVRLADWWQLTQMGVAGVIAKPFDCANLGKQIAIFLKWTT